jgi:hypothetical protein
LADKIVWRESASRIPLIAVHHYRYGGKRLRPPSYKNNMNAN